MTKNERTAALLLVGFLLVLMVVAVIFYPTAQVSAPPDIPATGLPAGSTAAPTGVWEALLQTTPFAYFTPLPEPEPSALDGLYTKVDQSWPQWWRCLRCADYRVSGGIWRLQFNRGVMRIFYEVNNWRSIASYSVAGDRLFIFNDPYCPEHTGEYRWSTADQELRLEVVEDPCAFDLRAENLTRQIWLSCTSADAENASTVDEESAPGCAENQEPLPSPVTAQPPLHVTVHGGDSRFFEKAPSVIVHANAADMAPPEGITVSFADESIPYGLQRVLWWNGDWIEITFVEPYSSVGVQFLGEEMIGWARVLLDGQEVWRGSTSAIWSKSGRHGGFVEVSNFSPGPHTLRVESPGFDYRPVTVAHFGLSTEGGVQNGVP